MKKFVTMVIILLLVGSTFSMHEKKVAAQDTEQVVKLNVPYMYQDDTFWCFLNSLSMVLQYYGARVHPWDMAREWNLGHEEGAGSIIDWLLSEKIEDYVESLGLGVEWHWESAWSFDFYKNHLDSSEPVVLVGYSTEWLGLVPSGGHAIVVTGYKTNNTGEYLYVHDPSGFFVNSEWGVASGKPIEGTFWHSYISVEVPWSLMRSYFINFANLVFMYTVIVKGSPAPPEGCIFLPSWPPIEHGVEYQNNNGQLYLGNDLTWCKSVFPYSASGQEIIPSEDLDIQVRVSNQFETSKSYKLNLEIMSEENIQLYTSSMILTLPGESVKQVEIKVKSSTLRELSPGKYAIYLSLWKPNPNYKTDQPYDRIGPINFVMASNYAAKDDISIFKDVEVVISSIRQVWEVNVNASVRAYLSLFEEEWAWTFYADAYMFKKDEPWQIYRDTGRTPLEFLINAYDPEGTQVYSGSWISTNTDNDEYYGDYSHLGGTTPSVHSPTLSIDNKPAYLIFKTKWRIYDESRWPLPDCWIISEEIDSGILILSQEPKFYINSSAENSRYSPGEISRINVDVKNVGTKGAEFILGVSFKDSSGKIYDSPKDELPVITLLPGEEKELLIEWLVPEDATLGRYEIAINAWSTDWTTQYEDNLFWVHAFHVRKFPALAVTPSHWDNMQSILDELNWSYENIEKNALTDLLKLSEYDVVFINCAPVYTPVEDTFLPIRTYVSQGGAIYASDWAYEYIKGAFPGFAEFAGHVAPSQRVMGNIVDDGLKTYLGVNEIEIEYDLDSWVPICSVSDEVTVYVSQTVHYNEESHENIPAVIGFAYGKGYVIYTSFHNSAQNILAYKLIEFLALLAATSEARRSLETLMMEKNVEVEVTYINHLNRGETVSYSYEVTEEVKLIFGVNWKGSIMTLSVFRPDGTIYAVKSSSTPPLIIEIPVAEPGIWIYSIEAVDVPFPNYPVVSIVGTMPAETEVKVGTPTFSLFWLATTIIILAAITIVAIILIKRRKKSPADISANPRLQKPICSRPFS